MGLARPAVCERDQYQTTNHTGDMSSNKIWRRTTVSLSQKTMHSTPWRQHHSRNELRSTKPHTHLSLGCTGPTLHFHCRPTHGTLSQLHSFHPSWPTVSMAARRPGLSVAAPSETHDKKLYNAKPVMQRVLHHTSGWIKGATKCVNNNNADVIHSLTVLVRKSHIIDKWRQTLA